MSLNRSFLISLAVVAIFVAVLLLQSVSGISLSSLGIFPRTVHGLTGILTAPFVHVNLLHLISNGVPFLVLFTSLLFFYRRESWAVIFLIYLLTGLGVWIWARPSYHIGSSGIVYGLAAFLFFSGLFRRNTQALTVSIVVAFLYGSMVAGIFPGGQPNVSWESHLIGACAGFMAAFFYRRYPIEHSLNPSAKHPDYPEAEPEGYRNIEGKNFRYQYKAKEAKKA